MSLESERQTRKSRIDPEITWAGWKIVDFDPSKSLTAYEGCAVREYPTGMAQLITHSVLAAVF